MRKERHASVQTNIRSNATRTTSIESAADASNAAKALLLVIRHVRDRHKPSSAGVRIEDFSITE